MNGNENYSGKIKLRSVVQVHLGVPINQSHKFTYVYCIKSVELAHA